MKYRAIKDKAKTSSVTHYTIDHTEDITEFFWIIEIKERKQKEKKKTQQ